MRSDSEDIKRSINLYITLLDNCDWIGFFFVFFYSNTIQFTPTQIEAIRAGMQPGLTMVRMCLIFI